MQVDAAVTVDSGPDIDAPPPMPLPLFAASDQMLYAIDVDLLTTAAIGPIAMGAEQFDVDGLALHGANLIGLSPGGAELITIDPSSAVVTSRVTLLPAGPYGGLTVAPAGELGNEAVVFAGRNAQLFKINTATGATTLVGSWGGGMAFFSDLAWVKGVGLFATLQGVSCFGVCFAKINPATGAATTFRTNLSPNLFGLSGYREQLWALDGAGPVLTVNQSTGVLTLSFDPSIPWTEAAQ